MACAAAPAACFGRHTPPQLNKRKEKIIVNNIQNHIKQIIDGEATPRHDSPELVGVLADIRAILRDRNAQQVLGLFVLQLVNAGIRSGLNTEKAMMRAKGASHEE